MLYVNKTTTMGELGRLPMCIERKVKIVKYLFKLFSNDNGEVLHTGGKRWRHVPCRSFEFLNKPTNL